MSIINQAGSKEKYLVNLRTLTFLTCQDEILLIKGAPQKRLWANQYNGIGGHVERGEDIFSSAEREIYEETGLMAKNLLLCGLIMINGVADIGICIIVLKGITQKQTTIPSEEGISEWLPRDGIYQYPLVEDLPIIIPRVLAFQPGDTPFSAIYTYDEKQKLKISFY
jgi:8-oxo-dGTP diphosphatase